MSSRGSLQLSLRAVGTLALAGFIAAAGLAQDHKPATTGSGESESRRATPPRADLAHPGEVLIKNVHQVTFDGEKSGEAYFSPDGKMVSFQSVRGDCPHYQIFAQKLDGTGLWQVTPGKGLTTCSHWRPDGKRLLWASTHLDPATYGPPPSEGGAYAWNKHPSFDIFESNPDGTDVKQLTNTPGYDAEGSYSSDGKRIVFTTERDGDYEVYTMAADGTDARRVTHAKGYDGGAFFSPDNKRICFRGFRDEKNPRLANLYVIDADGQNEQQLTFDKAVNWCPYWYTDGSFLVYSKNVGGNRNFELFLIRPTGGASIRVTTHPGADVLPVFSPDGKHLLWTSTRIDGRSQIFTADFTPPTDADWKAAEVAEARAAGPLAEDALFAHDVALADPAMEGRRAGTAGAARAAEYIERAFRTSSLTPAGENGSFRSGFDLLVDLTEAVPASVQLTNDDNETERLAGSRVVAALPFSGSRSDGTPETAAGLFAFRAWGVSAPGVYDDYVGLPSVQGRIVFLFLRGVPPEALVKSDNPHANAEAFSGSYAKALEAKRRGAAAVVFVADAKQRNADSVEPLQFTGSTGHLGIPVVQISRAAFAKNITGGGVGALAALEKPATAALGSGFDSDLKVSLTTAVREQRGRAENILGFVKGTTTPDEFVVVSAHYDHLGFGGQGSLSTTGPAIHPGADDNASGVAGLLGLAAAFTREPAARSLLFIAWCGEEEGLLGSQNWTGAPTVDLKKIAAAVNLDMIGRLGDDGVAIDGVATSAEFPAIINAANTDGLKVAMTAGAMAGRSDHVSFIHQGVPAIHLFTGAHVDYHTPTDTPDRLNRAGLAQVTALAGRIARRLADAPTRPAFVKPKAAATTTTGNGRGAWLGTIPSYGTDHGGVKLSGVSSGSPAEKAGLKAGDVLVKLGDTVIDNIEDFTAALGKHGPGDAVELAYLRGTERVAVTVTLGRR